MNPSACCLKKSCDNKLAKKQVKQRVRGLADSRISCLLVILLFVCLQPRSNKRKCFYHLHGIILSNGFLGLLSYCRVVFKPILVKPFWWWVHAKQNNEITFRSSRYFRPLCVTGTAVNALAFHWRTKLVSNSRSFHEIFSRALSSCFPLFLLVTWILPR